MEHLADDYKALTEVIDARRPEGRQPVHDKIGWLQKGPKSNAGEKAPNRHLGKFEECGVRCFDFARSYFADDFRVLDYPATLPAPDA